jgi:putative tryptophan/tyrosine transport system substrate-binding protein
LGASSASQQSQWTAAFVQRLRELGWTEGRNIAIEARWAEGSNERAAEFAAELVRRGPDVIVTSGTPIVLAAKRATATVPIVFATASDPVGSGLVESLPRPGGNVTGLSLQSPDLSGKRLELLRELIPGLDRLAVMASVGSPAAMSEMADVQVAGKTLGLDIATFEIRRTEDFAPAFRAMNGRAHALYVVSDPLFTSNRIRIHTLAMSARLPTMHSFREYVEAGGLVCYGASLPHLCAAQATMPTRFCAARSPPTCRSSSRPSLTWSST